MIDSNWTERLVINDSRVWVDISAKAQKVTKKRKKTACKRLCGRWVEEGKSYNTSICAWCKGHCIICGGPFKPARTQSPQKFCSKPCRARNKVLMQKRKYKDDIAGYRTRHLAHRKKRYYKNPEKEIARMRAYRARIKHGPRLENISGEGSN